MLRIKDPNVSIPFYTDASFSSTKLSSFLLSLLPLLRPDYRNGSHRKRANHILRYISDSPNDWFIAHTKPRIELEFSDFTLYFLAFDQSGGKATEAEKKANRHKREGVPPISPTFHRPGLRMTASHAIATPHIIQAYSSLPTIPARRPSTRRPTILAIPSRADSATSRSPWTTLRPHAHASRGWACHSKSALPMGRLRVLLSSWTRMDTGLR
jgi:hypothetical protein